MGSIVFLAHSQGSGTRNQWLFGFGGDSLYFYINGPGVGPHFLVQGPFHPVADQWYHLALTKDRGVYRIYANGVELATATNPLAVPAANAPLTIGQAQDLFLTGRLDE